MGREEAGALFEVPPTPRTPIGSVVSEKSRFDLLAVVKRRKKCSEETKVTAWGNGAGYAGLRKPFPGA